MHLLRSIGLISLVSFIFSNGTSNAMDDFSNKEREQSQPKRYFHRQNSQEKVKTIGTTNNAGSGDETSTRTSRTNSADSAEDNVDDFEKKEEIYTDAVKIKRSNSLSGMLKRVKSSGQAIKEKMSREQIGRDDEGLKRKASRLFFNKDKGKEEKDTYEEEEKLNSEKQVTLVEPIKLLVINPNDSVPETLETPEVEAEPEQKPGRGKIQRQRSWGRNPQMVTRKKQDPLVNEEGNSYQQSPSKSDDNIPSLNEETAMLPERSQQQKRTVRRGKSAYNLNETGKPNERGENISRKERQSWKRLSHERPLERSPSQAYGWHIESQEDLSPRQRRNLSSSKRLSQRRNPLQEGLSLYLNENGQPLDNQPLSPRYGRMSPRLAYSANKKETLIKITELSDLEILSGGCDKSDYDDEESSFSFGDGREQSLDGQEQSPLALKYEKNRGNASFIRIVDNRLFRPDPRMVVGLGVLGSMTFAALPPTAMTGVNVNVTGYYFNIPPGEWLSTTLVTAFMTTFTLALLKEGYEWGETISWPVWKGMKACYSCYTGTKEQEDVLSAPLMDGAEYTWEIGYKKSLTYYGINLFSFTAALSEGILPFALLSSVWAKDFSHLIIPFGTCVLVRYTGQAYNANTKLLRYLWQDYINQEPKGKFDYMGDGLKDEEVESYFYKENLDPEKAKEHKKAVREAIQQSLREGEENEGIAKEKYEIVDAERSKIRGSSLDEKEYFALSALIIKPMPDTLVSSANMYEIDLCRPSLNCLKAHYQKGIFLIQKPVDFIKILLKALALVGAGIAIEQGLRIVLQYWQPDSPWTPALISASSGTLIALYATKELLHMAKAVKEYSSPKASLATVSNFSLASLGATVPAGFSALVGVALGFQYVDESESSQKWKALMIAYGLDTFLSGHTHFKNKLQGFLTAAVTTIPEYTKECVVEYTPQFIKNGAGYLKEGIINNTPKFIEDGLSSSYNLCSKYMSPFYQRSWLWKWHHDLDEKVNDDNDSVTNAALYFTIEGQLPGGGSDDESFNGQDTVYHY